MSTKAIEQFLRSPSEGGAYDDQHLAALLAHAEDGKLSYFSCCCLIGIPTADHALRGKSTGADAKHYSEAKYGLNSSATAGATEGEFFFLGYSIGTITPYLGDSERCKRIIPLIHAEMARRDALKTQAASDTGEHGLTPEECFLFLH